MAYVAVKGGEQAIENSIELLKLSRSDGDMSLEVKVIMSRMKQLIDRVMCEAGFYAPEYAAIALKQCEGSMEEAVFLMRAYRSTLSREHTSKVIDCRDMRLTRRISSAFKDIPGGQMLGATYDYTHRLLDFSLRNEAEDVLQAYKEEYFRKLDASANGSTNASGSADIDGCVSIDTSADGSAEPGVDGSAEPSTSTDPRPPLQGEGLLGDRAGRVSDLLRAEGLMRSYAPDDTEPIDITKDKVMFPAPRSARLQTLFRADTGFVSGVGYAGMRGYGFNAHPTIGELRNGYVSVQITYPLDENESVIIGEVPLTEVEGYFGDHQESSGEHDDLGIAIGYGLAFGRAETKAIAMSILDNALQHPNSTPPNDEEFVLLHGESLEMTGFISHLKLPHYVTYQSRLDSIRKVRRENTVAAEAAGLTVEQLLLSRDSSSMATGAVMNIE
jgi:alpha-D-ribose 1-methylphosphonate 5-triphosphate synthase subunit PhnI